MIGIELSTSRLRLLDGFLQPPHDFRFGLRAYDAIDLLPRLQHQQRGNAANNRDLLLLARVLILGRHVQDAVGINMVVLRSISFVVTPPSVSRIKRQGR